MLSLLPGSEGTWGKGFRGDGVPYRVGSVNADVQPVPVQHHIMATQR
jgi:hypothetical protein